MFRPILQNISPFDIYKKKKITIIFSFLIIPIPRNFLPRYQCMSDTTSIDKKKIICFKYGAYLLKVLIFNTIIQDMIKLRIKF